ncbi:MAG TPA: hypothetical protein VFN64_11475 [Burkholderiaceae bacterium]|nr:hypothetical protein [Burkholderiaceae bacterium]
MGDPATALREIAGCFEAAGDSACALDVAIDDGTVVVTVYVPPSIASAELYHQLRYLRDLGQVRAFAQRYGIDPAKLEAVLLTTKE